MKRYEGDPYWVTVNRNSSCYCGKTIFLGERAFRYKDGTLLGEPCGCGCQAEREFLAAVEDEEFMNQVIENNPEY